LKKALELGADFVATGHYCQKEEIEVDGKVVYRLLAGHDKNKDQSYFLCQVTQDQLSKALFPIGHLDKPEVRKIALEQELVTAGKKDSQGLCFVGKIRLPDFLQQQLKPKKGKIVEIPRAAFAMQTRDMELETITAPRHFAFDQGEVVGEHTGAHYFTVGQRKGLQVGGKEKPLFVLGTDIEQNLIFAGQGDDHPGLYRLGLTVPNDEVHWVRKDLAMEIGETRRYMARIRYRQALEAVSLTKTEEGMNFIFDKAQRGVAPGQFVAWYDGEELIGSGVIH
jgi:tRNA-specific 2-thiouridylase